MKTAITILLIVTFSSCLEQSKGQMIQRSAITGPNGASVEAAAAAQDAVNQRQGEILGRIQQQQQAILAAQAQAHLLAEEKVKWDAAIAVITNKSADALAKLKTSYEPIIAQLVGKQSILQSKLADLMERENVLAQKNAHDLAKEMFQPIDPWRSLDGKIYNAKDTNWYQFTGKVLEIKPSGILFHGNFGPPLEAGFGERDYFVDNFPKQIYQLADGEEITSNMSFVAHLGNQSTYVYTNSTIDLGIHTVRRLDYGNVVKIPPPDLANPLSSPIGSSSIGSSTLMPEITDTEKLESAIESELSQAKSELSTKCAAINLECDAEIKDLPNVFERQYREKKNLERQALAAKVLAFNQEQAAEGDPVGLLRMGERYRDGDGVPKDLVNARNYLAKAADAGSSTASNELMQLNLNTTNFQALP